jgi:hypothetical protein
MVLLMEFRDHPDPLVRVQLLKVQLDQQVLLAPKALKEIKVIKEIPENREIKGYRVQLEQDIKLQAILLLF